MSKAMIYLPWFILMLASAATYGMSVYLAVDYLDNREHTSCRNISINFSSDYTDDFLNSDWILFWQWCILIVEGVLWIGFFLFGLLGICARNPYYIPMRELNAFVILLPFFNIFYLRYYSFEYNGGCFDFTMKDDAQTMLETSIDFIEVWLWIAIAAGVVIGVLTILILMSAYCFKAPRCTFLWQLLLTIFVVAFGLALAAFGWYCMINYLAFCTRNLVEIAACIAIVASGLSFLWVFCYEFERRRNPEFVKAHPDRIVAAETHHHA